MTAAICCMCHRKQYPVNLCAAVTLHSTSGNEYDLPCLAGRNWATPREVLSIIETLLPTGMGSFLELWAPQGPSRPGWTHLCQEAPPQPPPTHNQQQQGDEQQQQQQQQMQQQEAAHHMEALQPAA
jgi:hypothetical protein